MRKILSFFINRIVFFLIPFLLQFSIIVALVFLLEKYIVIVYFVMLMLALILVVYVISNDDNPAYKIGWIVIMLLVPIFGAFLYLLYGGKGLPEVLLKKKDKIEKETLGLLENKEDVVEDVRRKDRMSGGHSKYLGLEGFPTYKNTDVQFLSSGEEKFQVLLEDLKAAEHHIFMQYFIIRDGQIWQSILNVLEEKAKAGVDVRVLYDDIGCILTIPPQYFKEIRKRGIKCHVLNPLRIYKNYTLLQNNRDHRKICVIDGHIGYAGGINLGDEYANINSPYGKWKDCAIRMDGQAVWSLTVSFLKSWALYDVEPQEYEKFRPENFEGKGKIAKGYVTPYDDSPLDYDNVGENVYLNMINSATEEVYITTPYLIIPNELLTSLALAARRGVDVRIITPNIPDKKNAFLLTQSYYKNLVKAGVKIYQYIPGFIHSKLFITDKIQAVCGTINLDFRSLYLHFENAVWMYKCNAIQDMRDDYLETLKECREITISEIKSWPWHKKVWQAILRIFAPMF